MQNFISAVREDRSPGGKHRTKRARMDGDEEEEALDMTSLETQQNDIINILVGSCPDRIPQVLGRNGSLSV